jgi:hypothetical protein
VPTGAVDDRVLVDPADTRRIRPQGRGHSGWKSPGDEVQILEHATSRPVEVGAVLEDDVDEGEAEEGVSAHDLCKGHGQHRGRERVGDLVLHDLGRLSRELGEDDHLDVREVRNRIEGHVRRRVHAPEHEGGHAEHDDQRIVRRAGDDPPQHGLTPRIGPRAGDARRCPRPTATRPRRASSRPPPGGCSRCRSGTGRR